MLRRTKHSCAGSQVLKLSNCHVAQTDVWFISRPLILCLACGDVMWFAKLNGRAMEWMLLTVLTAHREEVYHRDNRLLTYISKSPGITELHIIFVSFFANIMIRCFLWQSCSHLTRMNLLTLHFLHYYTMYTMYNTHFCIYNFFCWQGCVQFQIGHFQPCAPLLSHFSASKECLQVEKSAQGFDLVSIDWLVIDKYCFAPDQGSEHQCSEKLEGQKVDKSEKESFEVELVLNSFHF